MAWSIRRRKGVNIGRVVGKLTTVLIGLWAGGTVLTAIGGVINGTSSVFYSGLSLIGYSVLAKSNVTSAGVCTLQTVGSAAPDNSCVYNYNGTGILSIIGIIGVASIVLD